MRVILNGKEARNVTVIKHDGSGPVIFLSNAILFLFETYICTQVPQKETFHSVWKNIIFFTTRMKKKGIRPNSWPLKQFFC